MRGGIFRAPGPARKAPDPLPGGRRHHKLFADLLRIRRRQQPGRVPGCTGRRGWSQARGLAGQVLRLAERHADELLAQAAWRCSAAAWRSH
jgi:hypothetical protein